MKLDPAPASVISAAVIIAAVDGDREAFAAIYRAYYPQVARYIAVRTHGWSHPAREDLAAEVFLRALKNIPRYRHQGRDIGAWLFTIARNLVYDAYKSTVHRYRSPWTLDECAESTDGNPLPDEMTHRAHLAGVLRQVIDELPQTQFDVIALRFYAGLSIAETAAWLGVDEGAVKARQYRACRALAGRDDVAALTRVE